MKETVLKWIDSIYHEHSHSYLLRGYVDRNYWLKLLIEIFPNQYIENMTDFNYSKCFSYYVNLSNTNAELGTEKFDVFLSKNLYLYRLEFQISAIAPFIMVKYLRYQIIEGQDRLDSSDKPFLPEHKKYEKSIKKFLSLSKLDLLDDKILTLEVQGISLELRKENVSLYNCLFQDIDSFFPY